MPVKPDTSVLTPDASPHIDREAISNLCRRYGVERLELFGSALGSRFDPARSDLDFVVTFEPMRPGEYAEAYFGLRDDLARLFDRAIDLVTDAALANPFLRQRIEAQKQTLFPPS